MEAALIKDLTLIVSLLSTVISAYYALKYKTEKNSDENTTTATNFKKSKTSIVRKNVCLIYCYIPLDLKGDF